MQKIYPPQGTNHKAQTTFAEAISAIGGFEAKPVLAIAVSGGADSMALLLLASQWAAAQGGKAVAITVDHGLRAESAQEAAHVANWCGSRQIEHHILRWQPTEKPVGSIQAAARDARYHLLSDWCRKHHARHLLTAHHQGDQAETLFFRLARGSGLRGLACMSNCVELEGLRLLRPLLSQSKESLIAYLKSQNQPWLEDPSNQNPAYTRNHIRQIINRHPDSQALEARAAKVAEAFGRFRQILDKQVEQALSQMVRFQSSHAAIIDAQQYQALAPEIALLMTAQLIQRLTGDEHPPRTQQLERLCRFLLNPTRKQATLAHVLFEYHTKQTGFTATYRPSNP